LHEEAKVSYRKSDDKDGCDFYDFLKNELFGDGGGNGIFVG